MNLEIPPDALAANQASRAGKTPEECKILKAKDYKLPGMTRYREGVMKEPFYFVHVVDPKFGGKAAPDEGSQHERHLMEKVISAVNGLNPKPKFLAVCGNFTNSKPNEANYFAEVETFKASFDKLDSGIPVICICGENDSEFTVDGVDTYRRAFGEDWFAFWVEGVQFIVLNSSYFKQASGLASFKNDQQEWLESVLLEALVNPPQNIIVLQSDAWFCNDVGEPEDDNNIDIQTRQQVVAKMNEAKVKAVISGNRNSIGKAGDLEAVRTSTLSGTADEGPAYRIFKVFPDHIVHKLFTPDNTPEDLNIAFT